MYLFSLKITIEKIGRIIFVLINTTCFPFGIKIAKIFGFLSDFEDLFAHFLANI